MKAMPVMESSSSVKIGMVGMLRFVELVRLSNTARASSGFSLISVGAKVRSKREDKNPQHH